ncbi:MAG TPA: helix-turn-helix transcriptional regulator [Pyrinomonadaceae bacterium]|jgi:putative transcriptional regulator|nr:helix-turn-helix transcriptional regulator [Pyrinomonadaceae bacterium]
MSIARYNAQSGDYAIKAFMIQVKLRDLLEARGRTRYWLAKETGIQYGTLMRIEQAELSNRIELSTLDKLCRALECQPGDLLVWVDDSRAESKRKVKGK